MVIDLKTHLSTIIAIFLSLGIGILIGTAMVGDDGIVMEQHRIITQIEEDLRELRAQNGQFRLKISSLEANLIEQEQFVDQLFQEAIADRLTGLTCLLISNHENKETDNHLQEILKQAGVEVTEYLIDPLKKTEEPGLGEEVLTGLDCCILLAQNLPDNVNGIFLEKQIYRPLAKNIETKKGLYQLVKSLGIFKSKLSKEGQDDLSNNSSI